jgi:hypothetical protein
MIELLRSKLNNEIFSTIQTLCEAAFKYHHTNSMFVKLTAYLKAI